MARPWKALLAAALLAVPRASGDAAAPPQDLGSAIAELEQVVQRQQARLAELEAEAQKLPEARRLSIYAGSASTYTWEADVATGLTCIWVLVCGALVFFMQAGYAMVEVGICRVKNAQNVLLKNLMSVCMSTLGWWIFGYSFAFSGPYGSDGLKEKWAGSEQFAGHHFLRERDNGEQEPSVAIVQWFFSWAVCCAAVAIASSGFAERVDSPCHAVFSFLMSSFVYPIVVAWTWGGGWLNDEVSRAPFFDYAGSGIVHLTGGVAALVGAAVMGARRGRFDDMTAKERVIEMPEAFIPRNLPCIVLGTFILWFGWYGFNCGITFALNDIEKGMLAAHIAMNTTIAASTAGLLAYAIRLALNKGSDISGFCNGILAGLVSISASCSSVECGSACAIGAVGALVYIGFSALLRVLKVDDPVDAFAVHGACGMWGVWAAFLFDWGKAFVTVHGARGFRCMPGTNGNCAGLSDSLGKSLFATSTAEVFAIIGWVFLLTAVIVLPMRFVPTRDADGVKESGYDQTKHTPKNAYDMEMVLPHTVI